MVLLTQSIEINAKDFGTQGHVFEIQEVDMLDVIKKRLQHMQTTGELEQMQNDMKAKAIQSANRPKPVDGLSETMQDKSWHFDPTYVLQHDLKDHRGVVFQKAGTKINPLDHQAMPCTLLFIDGDKEHHVKWALEIVRQREEKYKITLTNGAPIELMKKHKIQLYFDYNGILINKLGLQHVPAMVSQDGDKLLVQEIAVSHERLQ